MTKLAPETRPQNRVSELANAIQQQRGHARIRFTFTLLALAATTATLWLLSLMLGDSFYSLADVLSVIQGDTVPGASFTVGELRLPRATIAIVAGFAFGVCRRLCVWRIRNNLPNDAAKPVSLTGHYRHFRWCGRCRFDHDCAFSRFSDCRVNGGAADVVKRGRTDLPAGV